MRTLLWLWLWLFPAAARLLHSLPEDTYAFPKYRVAFLNGLPVENQTASRWLKEGLRGGELEFMDQPWKEDTWSTLDSPDGVAAPQPVSLSANYTLEHIKMGPRDSYICLTPAPHKAPPSPIQEHSHAEASPAHSWSLLQPLTGSCLYHRQGWFTYSYCHNDAVRQFKELIHSQPQHTLGGYKPEEDPEWESYTLGRAPVTPEPGVDLTVAQQNAIAANLELARNAGSQYLVQRWADGTLCDKTGKSREVEVQFHCSMTMTDNILFVKEAKTCSYVLVVQTPRLCGEPGFKSRRDSGEEAKIRCREIVATKSAEPQVPLPDADHPLKLPRQKPVLPPAQAPPVVAKDNKKAAEGKVHAEKLRKAIEKLLANKDSKLQKGKVVMEGLAEGTDVVIEYVDELPDGADVMEDGERLVEALRAAGWNVNAELVGGRRKDSDKDDKKKSKKAFNDDPYDPRHDEL